MELTNRKRARIINPRLASLAKLDSFNAHRLVYDNKKDIWLTFSAEMVERNVKTKSRCQHA